MCDPISMPKYILQVSQREWRENKGAERIFKEIMATKFTNIDKKL